MASIERRERGDNLTWRVQWRDPDGRRKSKTFERERDAKRYRAEVERSLDTGSYYDADRGKIT